MAKVTVTDKTRDEKIADAEVGSDAIWFEGNYYFDADKVEMGHLEVTDRIYICPYKGKALWIDLVNGDERIKDVAWVYQNPKPGFEHIKDRIGFYAGNRRGTLTEVK